MHYLVGADTVHTTAAICDYLDERATADDTVTAVAVVPTDGSTARRDAREALNVASVRLATAGDVETELRADEEGDAGGVLGRVAAELAVDEIVVTRGFGTPDSAGATEELRSLLEDSTVPVVVVPAPDI